MSRQNLSSGSPWEDVVGYSRAVRVGNVIEVAGTTAVNEVGDVQGSSAYEQTLFILKKVERAIEDSGGQISHVVRTRMFVTDISLWQEVGRAHGEFFKDIKPTSTIVEVSGLIDPKMLVEIEATAIIPL